MGRLAGLALTAALLWIAEVAIAQAADSQAVTLPTLALDPSPPPSLWTGLYVGTEIFAISAKGHKGLIGGAVDAGYNREFANNIVLGVKGSTGFSPGWGWGRHGTFKGFDYAETSALVGYDMGRLMPYVTAGLVLDKAHFGPGNGFQGMDSFNNLFNERGDLQAAGRVGAGVVYAVTPDIHVGLEVSVVNGGTPAAALAP